MPDALVIEVPGMDTQTYDRVMDDLDFGNEWPQGLISHYCAETPDGLYIFDVWESAADWEAYAQQRLGVAIAEATGGAASAPTPIVYRLHREERPRS
jgi:hypothetical protein